MTDGDKILVRALAAGDVIHLPVRDWSPRSRVAANRAAGLSMLAASGVPLRVGGSDANRKTGERQLAELAGRGLLTVSRDGRTKFSLVKLTEAGEARARALSDLPGRAEGRALLLRVAELAPSFVTGWVAEIALNDGKGWGETATREDRACLGLVELDYLPAAWVGWLESHSDFCGHAAYRPTALGLTEVATTSVVCALGELPAVDDEAVQLYVRERDNQIRELSAARLAGEREIGPLPLVQCTLLERVKT